MAPTDLPGLVVDGFDHTLAPHPVIGARPSINSIGRLGKVEAPTGVGVDDEQTVLRVEAGGTVVGHAALVGRNQASIGSWFLGGIGDRPALFVDSERPVNGPERSG